MSNVVYLRAIVKEDITRVCDERNNVLRIQYMIYLREKAKTIPFGE